MNKIAGKETWLFAGASLPDVEHEYCKTEGFETTATPFLPIPLMDPKDLVPMVSMKVKMEIQDPVGDGRSDDVVADTKAEMHMANVEKDAQVPLVTYGRHPALCKEKLHMCKARTCVNFSPGDGQLELACVELRIACLGICKSEQHRALLKSHIKAQLCKKIKDKTNTRFYRTSLLLGLTAEEELETGRKLLKDKDSEKGENYKNSEKDRKDKNSEKGKKRKRKKDSTSSGCSSDCS